MKKQKLQFPDNLDAQQFMSQYWQKKPLLMRNALAAYQAPISPEELAGLACEEDTESRIVQEKNSSSDKPTGSNWTLTHGPFDDTAFQTLPETHWTLLVQECNKHVPEIASLLDLFNFIPNWRVDDAMVSFAVPQGSVGPHVDQYDVFLLQAHGERRWQISHDSYQASDFLPDCDLRILKDFEPEQEWTLSAGDILYLPPGVAHHGVAMTDCMTISIGFRAPSHYQLINAFYEDVFSGMEDFFMPRFQDPNRLATRKAGLIDEDSLEKICDILRESASDKAAIKKWFGRFITESNQAEDLLAADMPYDFSQLMGKMAKQASLWRSEHFRFAYAEVSGKLLLYVNGTDLELTGDIAFAAELFCQHRQLTVDQLQPHFGNASFMSLLLDFVNKGYFYFSDE